MEPGRNAAKCPKDTAEPDAGQAVFHFIRGGQNDTNLPKPMLRVCRRIG
jgi:hypothetical protein